MTDFECGNCGNCPEVNALVERAKRAAEFAEHIAKDAMEPEFDEIVAPALFEMFPGEGNPMALGPNDEIVDSPVALASILRKSIGEFTNHLDGHVEQDLAEASGLIKNCQGPLIMRASKAGRQIMVTVCNSPSLPNEVSIESVNVKRNFSS